MSAIPGAKTAGRHARLLVACTLAIGLGLTLAHGSARAADEPAPVSPRAAGWQIEVDWPATEREARKFPVRLTYDGKLYRKPVRFVVVGWSPKDDYRTDLGGGRSQTGKAVVKGRKHYGIWPLMTITAITEDGSWSETAKYVRDENMFSCAGAADFLMPPAPRCDTSGMAFAKVVYEGRPGSKAPSSGE